MGVCEGGVNKRPRSAETPPKTKVTEIIVQLYKTMLANACQRLRSRIRRVMEAGVNLLGKAGCRYTKEHVCKISGQYIHFHRSYDSFCKVGTFVLIYRPHPVLCFVTMIEVKVISGHQVKKVKQNKIVI